MKKMTDEMIAIMKSYQNGEKIEKRNLVKDPVNAESNEFMLDENPTWNWEKYEYRVKKHGKRYRPFLTADEFFEAVKKHGNSIVSEEASKVVGDIAIMKIYDGGFICLFADPHSYQCAKVIDNTELLTNWHFVQRNGAYEGICGVPLEEDETYANRPYLIDFGEGWQQIIF